LPVGEVGAAQVRGPSMFVGYAREGRARPPELTPDGFLPTGDLVRLDPGGTITVLGRQKQIIIRGGRNIDVNEVEAAIARIPSVAQVCVVPLPDELLGERVAALVVSTAGPLGLADVTGELDAAGFPKAKWPEFVFDVPDLPQNRVGKLSRQDAAALAARLHGMT
jgi:non-ribosomal peptide synthetase component E (peptide arylation enzyme)